MVFKKCVAVNIEVERGDNLSQSEVQGQLQPNRLSEGQEEKQVKVQNQIQETADEEKKKPSLLKELIGWLEIVVAAIAISFFLTRVVLVNAIVPSSSMETLLSPGDRFFGNRLSYLFSEPERFDVVIFQYPIDEEENYVKRVIGLPGETVKIENARIYINDSQKALKENYLPEEWLVENDGYVFEVPEDCYLMLGDNRNVSADARYWADEAYDNGMADSLEEAQAYTYVRKDQILGKAVFTYWPHFQMLSDYTE